MSSTCCYKTDMSRKNKALALIALLFIFASWTEGCSASFTQDAKPHLVTADDGGKEEILDDDDEDEFGRPKGTTAESTAGGIIIAIGYLGMIVGSAILPLLVFL